jgi:transcriptional regulator with XRE-family HTH domain
MERFQERIRSTRQARNMSLEELGAASGFTKSHVWELERGRSRNPTVRAVWGLSAALGVTPAWLLGLDTDQSSIDPLALEIAALIERRISASRPSHASEG